MLSAFPCIAADEFAQSCQSLESRCQDFLEGTEWLSVEWDQNALYIKKKCKIEGQVEHNGSPNLKSEDEQFVDAETEEYVISRYSHHEKSLLVVHFSIILSPIYQVPVLWFTLSNPPSDGPQGIDAVYHYLVPQHLKAMLREAGVLGNISMAYHPVSDLPAFFIHPCNTHEALTVVGAGRDLTPESYLFLWLGFIGPAVGLYVPMAHEYFFGNLPIGAASVALLEDPVILSSP